MRIQNQSPNFGAISIAPKISPQLNKFRKTDQKATIEKANKTLLSDEALTYILKLSDKFNQTMNIGENKGLNSFNIMTKQGSEMENEILRKLSLIFAIKNINLDVKSISEQKALQSTINFDKETRHLKTQYA